MKNLARTTVLAICVLALVLQAPDGAEGKKKIFKKLKKLKGLKKYAWLLAAQRKKFYAIPFPLPLPVFVKRQQIYTQVPIIPRYVQHPSAYGAQSSAASSSAMDVYAMPSASHGASGDILGYMGTTPSEMSLHYPNGDSYQSAAYSPPSMAGQSRRRKKQSAAHSSSSSSSSNYGQQQQQQHFSTTALPASAKYLQQIASLIGQAYPGLMSAAGINPANGGQATASAAADGGAGSSALAPHRELLGKLLTGQAKVMTPIALLSTLKSAAPLVSGQQEPTKAYSGTGGQQSADQSDSEPNGPDYDSAKQTSEQGSSSKGNKKYQSNADSGDKGDDDQQQDQKQAATSEHRRALPRPLRMRMNQLALLQRQQELASLMAMQRFPGANLGALDTPLAAAIAASQMQRIPLVQAQMLAANGLGGGGGLVDLADDGQEAQESTNDHEQVATVTGRPVTLDRERLLASHKRHLMQQAQRHNHLMQQQINQPSPREVDPALAQRIMLARHHQHRQHQEQLYRAALVAREQQEAAESQLAETRAVLARARQLGMLPEDQLRVASMLRQRQIRALHPLQQYAR